MMGYLERIEMPRNMKAASIVNEAYCIILIETISRETIISYGCLESWK